MDSAASRPVSTLAPRDELPPAARRAVVAAVLALHVAAGWGLLQVTAVREAVAEAAPLFVDLVAPPAPPKPPEPPRPPQTPRPLPKTPPATPLIAAAPAPTPAPFVAPPPPPEPVPPAPPEPPVVVAAPALPAPPAPPPPPAPPKEIPAAAIQYLDPPAPVYPRLSRQRGETGTVLVRVYVDTDGVPRQVQVLQSSGHPRLDEAATAGVLKARFRPYSENGRPVAGWARIPIPFELEN